MEETLKIWHIIAKTLKAMIRDLVLRNRSRRRFYEEVAVSEETLRNLVDLARLSPSSGNLQPLRYILSFKPEACSLIFPALTWARYLLDWPGPGPGERPPAYIIVLGDREVTKNFGCDHGIAAQTILLGAVELGFGGCIMSGFDSKALRESLNIPERYEVLLVIAVGKPKEVVKIERVGPDGSIKYWRDGEGTHHVPKRDLDDIIIRLKV